MFEDNDPKEWELRDEEPPEQLQKKWDKEEDFGSGPVVCPSCKKESPSSNLTCIFCEAPLAQGSGFLSGLLAWTKRLFGKH